ncbi:MAG: tetratricopeptide repeat protein [Caldilineaceae bacterium]
MPKGLEVKIRHEVGLITGERREVSVLFASLHGLHGEVQGLDSEEIYLLTDEAMHLLIQTVYQFEGTVDKFTGRGLMALFGAPVTHEDDPERAIRAALAMLESLQPMQRRCKEMFGLNVQARIGLNTGIVIAGSLGSDLHMEYTVIGDTVNLAARLEGVAAPDTILVSFPTYQRTLAIADFQHLPPVQVKGKPEPIRAYQVVGLRDNPDRVRGLSGISVPMVGRQEMLEELLQTWLIVTEQKKRQVALITGDAGLGKSRLVAEVRHHLESGASIFQGSCLNYTRSTPFWVVGSLLRNILELGDGEAETVCQDRVGQYLQDLGLNASELTPYILNVLGIAQPSADLATRLAMMDATMLQQQTHVALHQVMRAEARRQAFILIFEDIHWIDSASRNFLIEFLRTSVDIPIFVMLVSRAYERSTVIQPIISVLDKNPDWNVDIQLQALTGDQEYSLIDQLLSKAGVRVPSIHRHIARRAEGNPFYIEEIVRMLLDKISDGPPVPAHTPADGSAGGEEGAGKWDAETLMESVPASLAGLILARFDNLEERLRRVMQIAAVIGRSFSVSLLQRLLQIEEKRVVEHLADLVERQFLIEELAESESGFSFRHALVQEAIYATLLHKNQRELHGAVAAALSEGNFLPPDDQAEALAYHYSHSDEPRQAIPHLVVAAQNANRRSAYESSLQFYRRGLVLFDTEPSTFSRIYSQIHVGLGMGLKYAGEFEEAQRLLLQGRAYMENHIQQQAELPLLLEMLRELADVCQRAGNFAAADKYVKEALSRATPLTGSPLWYTLVERAAWIQFRLGDFDECIALSLDAIQFLEERPDQQPFTLASFYNTIGGVAWQQSNLADAITFVEGSLKIYEIHGLVWGVSVACANLGVLYWTMSRWAAGTEWYERAAKIQEENGFSFELATSLRNLGYLRLAQGDSEIAYHYLEQSLALCLQQNHSYGALVTHLAMGTWAAEMEDAEGLSQHLQAAITYEEYADSESFILLRLLTAQDLLQKGEFHAAIQCAQEALQLATEGGMQAEMVEVNHTLGVVHARAGEVEQAENYLTTAQNIAKERNSPDRMASAQLELALLYERMAHTASGEKAENWKREALVLVRAAIDAYERLGARLKLRQARALEEKLYYHSKIDEPLLPQNNTPESAGGIRISLSSSQMAQAEASAPSDGERVHVTILWANVTLRGVEDEEDAFSQTAEVLGSLGQIIRQRGGHLIRHSTGVTAVFGAPVASEDAPGQAIHCAVEMAAHLSEAAAFGSGLLTFQIGMDYGSAVVGYLDPRNRSLFVVTGEPMTRAERLAGAVPAGAIWLTAPLAKLTERDYHFEPVSADPDLSDIRESVLAYASPRLPADARGLHRNRTRLIGRGPILDILMHRAQGLEKGESGFVWLEGEAGIGKSRLLAEFCNELQNQAIFIWQGHCSAQNTQHPFHLFSTLLHDIFGFGSATSIEDKRHKLQARLDELIQNGNAIQPFLELLCGISPAPADAHRLANLEPEALRRQIFVALRTLLVGMLSQQPIVLVLDDLHWLDPMSANLLVFLSQMAASMPILFVLAHRPTENEAAQSELNTIRTLYEDRTWRLALTRLSREDSRALLSELLPSGSLSLNAYRFILERSDGNPYYMEEFLRLLIEQGYLQQDGNIWSPRADTSLNDLPLPVTLEALIRSRVDSLPPQQRQLLQLAAVIGRPFSLRLLAKLVDGPVESHLQELSRRNLVAPGPGKSEWQFNHHIAQIVIYNSMLRVRLKALHLQVADTLEEDWGTAADEHAEEMAHHLSAAEENRRALRYLVLAGERAEAHYANDDALAFYRNARDILRENVGVVPDELQWRVIAGLGDTYRFVGKYDLSASALEEGLALIERNRLAVWRKAGIYRRWGQTCALQGKPEIAYDHFRQALVALEEPSDREGQIEAARTLYYLAYNHFRRGQWEKAKETCEMCFIYAEKASDLSELAAVENLLGGIAYQQGDRQLATQRTANALHLRERAGYTWGVASTMGNLAILASESGDWDRAKRYFLRSLHLREELGDTEGQVIVNNNLGWLGRIKGTLDEAVEYFRESLQVADTFKMIYHAANAMLGIGHICQLKGDIAEAQRMITVSIDRAEQVDAQGLLSEIYRVQAEILLDENEPEEAEESARWAVLLATEIGSSLLEAEAWRVVSECQYRQGHLDKAEETIREARMAQAANSETIESGRVALQAGRLLAAQGRIQEADVEFSRAETILQQIGAEYDLSVLAHNRRLLSGSSSWPTDMLVPVVAK